MEQERITSPRSQVRKNVSQERMLGTKNHSPERAIARLIYIEPILVRAEHITPMRMNSATEKYGKQLFRAGAKCYRR